MDPFRKKKATTALLEALDMADGYPLADSVVRSYLQDLVKPPLKDAEWKDMVEDALKNKLIVTVPSKLDDELVQYTITERGQAVKSH